MKRNHGRYLFETASVENRMEGWGAIELFSTLEGKRECVARITFWDATAEFTVETFGGIVPLPVLEDLIREARESVELPQPR